MRTDWKSLKGKKILAKQVFREAFIKHYGTLFEWNVTDVSPNGVCVKLEIQWFHRDDIKLVEVLE